MKPAPTPTTHGYPLEDYELKHLVTVSKTLTDRLREGGLSKSEVAQINGKVAETNRSISAIVLRMVGGVMGSEYPSIPINQYAPATTNAVTIGDTDNNLYTITLRRSQNTLRWECKYYTDEPVMPHRTAYRATTRSFRFSNLGGALAFIVGVYTASEVIAS